MLTELWTLWLGQFSQPEQALMALAALAVGLPALSVGVERLLWSRARDGGANADAAPGATPVWPQGKAPVPLTQVTPWGAKVRVMVFMDHPNFGKSWQTEALNLGWPKGERFGWPEVILVMRERVAAALNRPLQDVEFVGVHVYDSFVPLEGLMRRGVTFAQAEEHYGLRSRQRLLTKVAALPGVFVHVEDRTLKLQKVRRVDGFEVIASEEKGVDTSIATDMVRHAGHQHYDYAVLMADDTDYVPVLRTMRDHLPQPVISAGFHRETRLRSVAWARIDFDLAFMRATRSSGIEHVPRHAEADVIVKPIHAAASPVPPPQPDGRMTAPAPPLLDRAVPIDPAGEALIPEPMPLTARHAAALSPEPGTGSIVAGSSGSGASPRTVIRPNLPGRSATSAPTDLAGRGKRKAVAKSDAPRKRISFGTIMRVQPAAPAANGVAPRGSSSGAREANAWDAMAPADPSAFPSGTACSALVVSLARGRVFIISHPGQPAFRGVINRSSFSDKARYESLMPEMSIDVVVKGFNERGTLLAIPREGARVSLLAPSVTTVSAGPSQGDVSMPQGSAVPAARGVDGAHNGPG